MSAPDSWTSHDAGCARRAPERPPVAELRDAAIVSAQGFDTAKARPLDSVAR